MPVVESGIADRRNTGSGNVKLFLTSRGIRLILIYFRIGCIISAKFHFIDANIQTTLPHKNVPYIVCEYVCDLYSVDSSP